MTPDLPEPVGDPAEAPQGPSAPAAAPHGAAPEPPGPLASSLASARSVPGVFDVVKAAVERSLGKSRAGLMVGLADLGAGPSSFLGGYFPVGSNLIVVNRTVLRHVRATRPDLEHPYLFHVLLHEYLHTLGYLREDQVRPLAHDVSARTLGDRHPATRIAAAMAGRGALDGDLALFRDLAYPAYGWFPRETPPIRIVKGLDPDATPYIM